VSQQNFPAGWDEKRVKDLIAHYERMDENEMLAEDEAAEELVGQTLMVIPTELVPEVLELIRRNSSKTT
jgi:hypothetical protein